MKSITYDPTLKVGDLVFSTYKKNDILYKISKIERRFLTKDDLRYEVYKDCKVGDEYSPCAVIIPIENLSINKISRKMSKSIILDASWLKKVSYKDIENHIHKLNKILKYFSHD